MGTAKKRNILYTYPLLSRLFQTSRKKIKRKKPPRIPGSPGRSGIDHRRKKHNFFGDLAPWGDFAHHWDRVCRSGIDRIDPGSDRSELHEWIPFSLLYTHITNFWDVLKTKHPTLLHEKRLDVMSCLHHMFYPMHLCKLKSKLLMSTKASWCSMRMETSNCVCFMTT